MDIETFIRRKEDYDETVIAGIDVNHPVLSNLEPSINLGEDIHWG